MFSPRFPALWIALVGLILSGYTSGKEMAASSFVEYASSPDLTADEIYTIELLIERVRGEFDPEHWEQWMQRSDARETPDYKPSFSMDHIRPAARELKILSWLSFQRTNQAARTVRDLRALRYLPELSELVLSNNEVSDLTPLKGSVNLRRLHLSENPVRDITPLVKCLHLEELDLSGAPIEDFSALQNLPRLRELSISIDQIPALKRLENLPALRKLVLGSETFESFEDFPDMPELRVIQSASVRSLAGLERFPKLENLVNFVGEFDSLEPLREAKSLTHVNILRSRVGSLDSLAGLSALRAFWLNTEAPEIDLAPLDGLPALHEVTVKCGGDEVPGLQALRADLLPWDVEFRFAKPRHTPSLELEVVDQKTFDLYDTQKPFNVPDAGFNEELLSSELEWLDEELDGVFAVDFTDEEDYVIPFRWAGARSRTVALLSDEAVEAFPRLVLGMQEVLASAKEDWIIYLQSEDEGFIVWVYPDKIMVTKEDSKVVRKLIQPR